jgi:tetratricopeptide (TPR) repeat protein
MKYFTAFLLCSVSLVVMAQTEPQKPVSVKELVSSSQKEADAGRLDEALALARQAVALDAAYGGGWRQLGSLLARSGQRKEALEALQTAVQLAPDDGAGWRDLGWLLWLDGKRDDAITAWNRAVSAGVPNPEDLALQVLGALAEVGRAEEGWKLFRKWAPGHPILKPALELVNRGRTVAARSLLERAWADGENPPISGLYLAYANAVNGSCASTADLLAPFIQQIGPDTEIELLDIALETLLACPTVAPLQEYLAKIEQVSGGRPQNTARITDILEKAAEDRRARGDARRALELYRRVLERDPDRLSWIIAIRLADEVDGPMAAADLMRSVLNTATSVAVRAGIEAKMAHDAEQWEESALLYAESLEAAPDQPLLRQNYVNVLLALGRTDDARAQAEWFAERIERGDQVLRSYLAELWERLGDYQKALDLWQILYLSQPNIPYYPVQAASMMFRLCDAEGALNLLQQVVADHPYPQAYELMAEIYSTLGRPADATEQAALGIAATTPTLGLLRQYAENAEAAQMISTGSLAATQTFLERDPSRPNVATLHGQQLWVLGMTNEAVAFHEMLLQRNPAFLPARVFLKDAYSARREFKKAVEQSKAFTALLPDSVDLVRRHALALGEYERWHRALAVLRKAADQDARRAVPVLIYNLRQDCDYPARSSVAQARKHIEQLSAEGYSFLWPHELHDATNYPAVVLIFADLSEKAALEIDDILNTHQARAVYAGSPLALAGAAPGQPSRETLNRMRTSRRWIFASSGPEDRGWAPVAADGRKGNPLTHRLWIKNRQESLQEYRQRLDRLLSQCTAALPNDQPKLFLYPAGDFGQLSLDTGLDEIAVLNEITHKHFDYAMYLEDPGFIPPNHSDLRLPARLVPGDWDAEQLLNHLRRRNPVTRAYLDLAKLLYWSRQHEAANVWFQRAAAAGADPWETTYNWGANAYQQGDLKTSRAKLRAAAEIDPSSEKTQAALQRTENDRKPELRLFAHGWDDNEDRLYRQWGGEANVYVGETLRLGVLADRNRWETEPIGEERGTRAGVQARWYITKGAWVDGRAWRLDMDDLEDHNGGELDLRLPNRLLSGHVNLVAAREEMETVEALRADIYQNRYAARTYSRWLDVWDLYANLTRYERTDDNRTTLLDGRLVYRIKEWPFLGAGYAFRFGDSNFDPPEYWAPEELEQHQVYGSWRGVYGGINHQFSAQAGYARERNTDWEFVWGGRAAATVQMNRWLSAQGEISYFEGPIYNRTTWTLAIMARF